MTELKCAKKTLDSLLLWLRLLKSNPALVRQLVQFLPFLRNGARVSQSAAVVTSSPYKTSRASVSPLIAFLASYHYMKANEGKY